MRQLERERRGVWFAEYTGKVPIVDSDGMLTGEYTILYGAPQLITPTVSPRSGNSWFDGFGVGVDCDRTAILDEIGTGITETCVLWVDVRPELDEEGNLVTDDDGLPTVPYDYTIQMVAESYNYTAIAMKKAM